VKVMPTALSAPRSRGVPETRLAAVLVFLAVESTAVASLGTPLLPAVQQAEHVSLAASQWTLTITLLAGAVVTPVLGRLGDGRLRRRATLGAVAVMLAGCVLSALPAGFAVFLAGRALQGAGFGLAARRTSPELVVAASCVVLIASMALFLVARGSYAEIVVIMALAGFGVGCVYAVNPLQITSGVPADQTGSAISFYQLVRTVAYSIASALSATVLVLSIPAGRLVPADGGYSGAAVISIVVLGAALAASVLFAVPGRPPRTSQGPGGMNARPGGR
jgi:MFS family permease